MPAREKELEQYKTPAGEIYTGMQHLRLMEGVKTLRESFGNDIVDLYIVSAGYGLISEHRDVVPYEVTFNNMSSGEIGNWSTTLGMRIIFNGLYDVKEFILMVDIYQFCDKEKEWGGKGYIIRNWYEEPDSKKKIVIEESNQSQVIRSGGDCIIITPYYKQISWLFNMLYHYSNEGNLSASVLLNGFSASCEEYFKKTPDHSAKELMIYILEQMQLKDDLENGYCAEE